MSIYLKLLKYKICYARCFTVRIDYSKASQQSANITKSVSLNNKDVKCDNNSNLSEEDDLEEMFILGPSGMEWNGPTRGGSRPEPTRYGDWERKGRASDF